MTPTDDQFFARMRQGAVLTPTNNTLSQLLQRLTRDFPISTLHRQALRLLGSEIVYAAPDTSMVGKGCWIVHVRFGRAIEQIFGLTREVLGYYSPYEDFQIRTFQRLPALIAGSVRKVSPDICLFYSPDTRLETKVKDWSSGAFTTLPLPLPNAERDSHETARRIFRILALRLASRDLYYETLPVTGDQFFGRTSLLVNLLADIKAGRVCGLFGLRKSGKTSVVKQLGEILRNERGEKWCLCFEIWKRFHPLLMIRYRL